MEYVPDGKKRAVMYHSYYQLFKRFTKSDIIRFRLSIRLRCYNKVVTVVANKL
jgi:hypothetical protein